MLAIFCFLICLVHCTYAASFEQLNKNVLSHIAQAMPWESRIRFAATIKIECIIYCTGSDKKCHPSIINIVSHHAMSKL